jgi:hypothetical protein
VAQGMKPRYDWLIPILALAGLWEHFALIKIGMLQNAMIPPLV